MLLKMAWRNLWRNRRRSLLTMAAIGLGLAVLIVMSSLVTGMIEMMVNQIALSGMGHVQVHHPQYVERRSGGLMIDQASNRILRIEGVEGVRAVSPRLLFSGSIRSGRSASVHVVQVVAVDPARESALSALADKVVEGGFVVPPPEAIADDAPQRMRDRKGILLGARLARDLKVELGSKVRVDTAGFTGDTAAAAFHVTGILRTGSDSMDKGMVWVSLKDMQAVTGAGDAVHEIAITMEDPTHLEPAAGAIREALGPGSASASDGPDGPPPTVRPWWDVSPDVKMMVEMSGSWTYFLYMLLLAILSAGILSTMFMLIYERSREFGVRLALGTNPMSLFAGLMIESGLMAVLASGMGLAVGGVAVALLHTYGVDLSWLVGGWEFGGLFIENVYRGSVSPAVFIEPTVFVFLGTLLIALWPSIKVARMHALEAFRSGATTG